VYPSVDAGALAQVGLIEISGQSDGITGAFPVPQFFL
jgi:hypothetical protein